MWSCWDVDGLGDCCVPFDHFSHFAGVLTTGPAIPSLTIEVWCVFLQCDYLHAFWVCPSGQIHTFPVWGSVSDAVSLLFFLFHKITTPRFCLWCKQNLRQKENSSANTQNIGVVILWERKKRMLLPLCFLSCPKSKGSCSNTGIVCLSQVALEWFFTSVKPFMHSQVVILYKSHVTVVALKWFFTSVKPFMHSQVVLLDEFLVTVEWC